MVLMFNGRGSESVESVMDVLFYIVSSRLSESSSTINYSKPNALDLRTFGWLMAMWHFKRNSNKIIDRLNPNIRHFSYLIYLRTVQI